MGKKKLILLVAIMLSLVACNSSTDKKYSEEELTQIDNNSEEEIKGQLDLVEDGEPQVLNIAYMPNYGSLWAIENAINFLKLGVDVETVAKGTGLSIEKIRELNSNLG